MTLIELLEEIHQSKVGGSECVFLAQTPNLPDSKELAEDEIANALMQTEVRLEPVPHFLANCHFIGTKDYLLSELRECRIDDIRSEFKGFCRLMGW